MPQQEPGQHHGLRHPSSLIVPPSKGQTGSTGPLKPLDIHPALPKQHSNQQSHHCHPSCSQCTFPRSSSSWLTPRWTRLAQPYSIYLNPIIKPSKSLFIMFQTFHQCFRGKVPQASAVGKEGAAAPRRDRRCQPVPMDKDATAQTRQGTLCKSPTECTEVAKEPCRQMSSGSREAPAPSTARLRSRLVLPHQL